MEPRNSPASQYQSKESATISLSCSQLLSTDGGMRLPENALIVGVGTNVQALVDALRKNNINVEDQLPFRLQRQHLSQRRKHRQNMPGLSVSLVAHGCYWRAGEDVPPEELPAFALKYVVPADDSDSSKSPQPAPPPKRQVKPGSVPDDRHAVPVGPSDQKPGSTLQ